MAECLLAERDADGDLLTTIHYEIPATDHNNPHNLYTIIHTNSTATYPYYYYEGCRGIKTGSTSAAGKCLIVCCEREGPGGAGGGRRCAHDARPSGWHGVAGATTLRCTTCWTIPMTTSTWPPIREVYADEIAARQAALQEPEPEPEPDPEPEPEPDPEPDQPAEEPDDTPEEGTQTPSGEAAQTPEESEPAPEPETPAEPAEEPAQSEESEASEGIAWYGWLLIGVAGLLVVYTAGYLIHNLTRPMRRKRRPKWEDEEE